MDTNAIWFFVALMGLTVPFGILCGVEGGKAAKREGRQYDERQLLALKGGYQAGFIVLAAYYVVYALGECFAPRFMDFLGYVGILTGVLLAALVILVISVAKDAYFTPKTNKKAMLWLNVFLAGVWGLEFALFVGDGLVQNGRLHYTCLYLEVAVIYLVAAVAPLIRERARKNGSGSEEDGGSGEDA